MPMLDTVLSCSCSPSVSRNSGSISSVLFKSKAPIPKTWSGLTSDLVERTMGANLLIDLNLVSTAFKSSSLGTRSHLFKMSLSAKATLHTFILGAFRLLLVEVLDDVLRIDQRNDPIELAERRDLVVHEERLRDRRRVGHARRLDDDRLDRFAAFMSLLQLLQYYS